MGDDSVASTRILSQLGVHVRQTDALRQRYAYFSQGDLERGLDLWTDDFVGDGD